MFEVIKTHVCLRADLKEVSFNRAASVHCAEDAVISCLPHSAR
jgi:hypothetical protein